MVARAFPCAFLPFSKVAARFLWIRGRQPAELRRKRLRGLVLAVPASRHISLVPTELGLGLDFSPPHRQELSMTSTLAGFRAVVATMLFALLATATAVSRAELM